MRSRKLAVAIVEPRRLARRFNEAGSVRSRKLLPGLLDETIPTASMRPAL